MSVQSVLFVHRPSNCCPLIAPHSPPGIQQFFCWIRERLSAAPVPIRRGGKKKALTPHNSSRGESFWGERRTAPLGG